MRRPCRRVRLHGHALTAIAVTCVWRLVRWRDVSAVSDAPAECAVLDIGTVMLRRYSPVMGGRADVDRN